MEYNKRKLEVLKAVYDLEEATSREVYNYLEDDCSLNTIQVALLRYYRQGLLSRSGNYEKVYEITPKGIERLTWLQKTFFTEEDEVEEDEEYF